MERGQEPPFGICDALVPQSARDRWSPTCTVANGVPDVISGLSVGAVERPSVG
jgi:hypothetical protein